MLTTFKIHKSDSGWPESYEPSSDEMKAYFLGWRLCGAAGAPYVSGDKYWHKWTDLSAITATCPTTSYVGSERYLAVVADDTGEAVSVNITNPFRIFHGENIISTDTISDISLEWTEIKESIEDRLIAGHKYLVYLEGKANDTGVLDATLTVTNGVSTVEADPWTAADTDFARRFLTFTPETVADWQLKVITGDTASTPVDYTFRNLDIIDLTSLGELNTPMQEVFEVTNWYDLTDEQLEEYFDEVGHIDVVKAVGYTFDGGQRAFSVNNYGDTLDSTPISTVEVDTELHGWNGIYDEFNTDTKTTRVKRLELQYATVGDITKLESSTTVDISEMTASVAYILDCYGRMLSDIELLDSDTGFSSITPDADDIKRYFNGWKYIDGTDYSPIGYTGDSVDASTALASLVTDIYPDADWRPWTYIYQLDEAESEAVDTIGRMYLYVGDNIIATDVGYHLPMYVGVKADATALNDIVARAQDLVARVTALEEAET